MSIYLTKAERAAQAELEDAEAAMEDAGYTGRCVREAALKMAVERKNSGGTFKSITGQAAVYARFIDEGKTAASQ